MCMSMYEIFMASIVPINQEYEDHICLHDHIFSIAARLNTGTVCDFTKGALREEIESDLIAMLGECVPDWRALMTIAHDINGKMNIMQNTLKLLKRRSVPEFQIYDYIMRRNQQLASLIVDYIYPFNTRCTARQQLQLVV